MELTRENIMSRRIKLSYINDSLTWRQVEGGDEDLWLENSWRLECGYMHRYFNSENEIIYYLAKL